MKNKLRILLGRFRQWIDKQLQKRGYRLVKLETLLNVNVSALIGHFCPKDADTFFLQIGAHDGVTDDHLSHFRSRANWSGLMLEPNPVIFPRLQKNLAAAGNPKVRALQCALGENDNTLPFFVINQAAAKKYPNFPKSTDQWSSLSEEILSTELLSWGVSREKAPGLIEKISVETISFRTLLNRHNIARVDVLLLDVEGLDAVLLEKFPLETYLPRLVVCEWNKMTTQQLEDSLKRFSQFSYCWFFVGWDLVFVRSEYLTPKAPFQNRVTD